MVNLLIINADDFGLSLSVNRAVINAHHNGILTSATLMANASQADEALFLAKESPSMGLGVNLNLFEGKPICSDGRVEILCDHEGHFKYSPTSLALNSLSNSKLRKAIEIEFAAQMDWFFEGKTHPTHVSTYKHIHCFKPIFKIVVAVAKKFGIDKISKPFSPSGLCSSEAKSKKPVFLMNSLTRMCNFKGSGLKYNDKLVGIMCDSNSKKGFWDCFLANKPKGVIEIASYVDCREGIENCEVQKCLSNQFCEQLNELCEDEIKQKLKNSGYRLGHYGNL